MKLNATSRITAAQDDWWKSLTKEQKRGYIEEHPNSKYAKQARGEDDESPKKKGKGEEKPAKPLSKGAEVAKKYGIKPSDPSQSGTDRNVKYLSTEKFAKEGKPGLGKYGFWMTPDTWVSMSKKEYDTMPDEDITAMEDHGEELAKKDKKGKDKDYKKEKKEHGKDFKGLKKRKDPAKKAEKKLNKKLKKLDRINREDEPRGKAPSKKEVHEATDHVIKSGGAKPDSKDRSALAEHISDNAGGLAKGLLRGSKDALKTTHLGLSLLTRKGRNRSWSDEEKRAARHTALRAAAIIGTSVAAGTGLGTAALIYSAVKWMALPMLKKLFIGAAKRLDGGSSGAWASVTAGVDEDAQAKALMEELAEYVKSGDIPMEAITEFA